MMEEQIHREQSKRRRLQQAHQNLDSMPAPAMTNYQHKCKYRERSKQLMN